MTRMIRCAAASLLAVGLTLGLAATRAGAQAAPAATTAPDASQKGSITGTVTGADDKPASGVQVRLFKPFGKGERKAAKAEKQAAAAAVAAAAPGGEKAKPDRPEPLATKATDADGKFEMADVPAGKYVVMAAGRGHGSARETIEVKAGESAAVTLKLQRRDRAAEPKGEKPVEKNAEPK